MHSRSNTGIGIGTKIFIVAVVLAILIAFMIWGFSQIKIETPTLEVSNVSLNPNEIKVKDSATLSFTIKNKDAVKPHSVKVVFNTTSPVTFIQNDANLSVSDGLQYLPITLQSSQQSTYPLKVTGTLIGGASTSTYSVRIEFYDENSTKFDTETQSLKINS